MEACIYQFGSLIRNKLKFSLLVISSFKELADLRRNFSVFFDLVNTHVYY